ncbi:phage terminase large subunit GpA-like protein [Rhodoplanes tepidamans]|nr:phage terminase large subunit GpA-like protein [Rhodoplanes tepidamans]
MGAQSGKTETFLDVAGQRLDQRPAPILYVGPNDQFLREQFEPRVMALLDEAPSLADKVARGKRMTRTRKVIAGVPWRLASAQSSSALKSDPFALALVDEYDEMVANIRGQGDPLGLIERRGDTYADFCCAVVSTPTIGTVKSVQDEASGLDFWDVMPADDIESPIWRLWQQGTRHHWCWPCPHCGDYFVPRFDLLRWPEGASPAEAAKATYIECPHCGGVVEEQHKADMNERGRYVAPGQAVDREGVVSGEPRDAATISFWTSGLASPFVAFGDRVRVYLEAVAMADSDMVQTAVNAGFGELYARGGIHLKEWEAVAKLRQPYRMGEVPSGVLRLTMAVDVQKNRLVYSIRGWGARATSWQIESGELAGYTDEQTVWGDLADLITGTWGGLPISLVLIDSGFRPNKVSEGSANIVYDFCRRFSRLTRPTKGHPTLDAPIKRSRLKVTVPGQRMQVPVELINLDTDFWKSRLHERLAWPFGQPGSFTIAGDSTDDYCKQLVSEVRQLTPGGRAEWVQVSKNNHFLDCEAMNEAAGHLLNMQRVPLGAGRRAETPPETEVPAETPPPAATAKATRNRMADLAARLNR